MKPDDRDLRATLAGPVSDLLEAESPRGGDHPDLATLTAYREGDLDADGEERVKDHLVRCQGCLRELLELDAFLETDVGSPAPGVADLEAASAWRALRPRLEAAADAETGTGTGGRPDPGASAETGANGGAGGAPAARPSPSGPRRLAWMAAAAAAITGVALLGWWGVGEHREAEALRQRIATLSRPQAGAAIVDLFPSGAQRSAGMEPAVAELPARAPHVTLVVNLPGDAGPPPYAVEILDSAGAPAWSAGGLRPSRYGTLRVGLPRGALPPGVYTLRVLATGGVATEGGERRPVADYELRRPPP